MNFYHLGLAWNWEYDEHFLLLIEKECAERGFKTIRISESNLIDFYRSTFSGESRFAVVYDRASDSDEHFAPLMQSFLDSGSTRVFNPYPLCERVRDKATMHMELMSNGIYVPHSLILPSFNNNPFLYLRDSELKDIGKPFVIKPANSSGGGLGVVLEAESMMDIFKARQELKNDKYLVQETITPTVLDGKRAWFRVLYAFGEVIPCWWDDRTHIYEEVTPEEELLFSLSTLRSYVHTIHKLCRLDFFSTEIALTADGSFIAVDYVNEVCDMRPQSECIDGVPDSIISKIVTLLVNEVEIEFHKSQLQD